MLDHMVKYSSTLIDKELGAWAGRYLQSSALGYTVGKGTSHTGVLYHVYAFIISFVNK